ncbi:MAG: ROK family protein [Desulfitobacteriaceae bacterium]
MKKYMALDIGGTTVKFGILARDGKFLHHSIIPTQVNDGTQLIGRIVNLIDKYNKEYELSGVAVCSPGNISPATGEVIFANKNLPGWTGTPIKQILVDRFKVPVHVANDVNAAALGEKWQGAGIGKKDFLCLTLGTGIGGAIVLNDHVYLGEKGFAGEFGHIIFEKDGRPCACGRKGCWEQYGSTSSLVRYVKEHGSGSQYELLDGRKVFELAKDGDEVCLTGIEWFVDNLSLGLANLIHIFNPPLIILGGAISNERQELLAKIFERTTHYTLPSFMEKIEIVFAKCGNNAGMLGALYGLLQGL